MHERVRVCFICVYVCTLTNADTQTSAGAATTTMSIGSVCPKCGTVKKSGKTSCCGRGGSWFQNCGSGGNRKLQHTWSEGVRACTNGVQSQGGIGPQLHASQQNPTRPTRTSVSTLTTAKNVTVYASLLLIAVVCCVFVN